MTTNPHLPAGPYQMLVTATINEHQGSRHVYVIDGTGRKIASIWGKQDEKLAIADLLISAREGVTQDVIMAWIATMTDDQRGDFITAIRDTYCIECFTKQEPVGSRCQCWNDE